jgi:glucose/arabinose dehydrogenase
MRLSSFSAIAFAAAIAPIGLGQMPVHPAPRPPAPVPGAPPEGSAAPDGYAPIPQWLGQTRAPHPAPSKASPAFEVETVASGLNGAFCFSFLPDGRILVGERPGHIKIVSKDGAVSEVGGLPSNLYARNGLFEVRADRAFATNRLVYLTYLVLPEGVDPTKVRSPGVLVVARATLSADGKRLEDVHQLLDAEGTGGRLIQARDGTLLVTSTIPAGVGINSVDWPQPQQLGSDMGKVLRINSDGSIPKDNPFAAQTGAHPEIFALGFRDVQGVTINPRTGALWTSEHGPRGGDEINIVEKGKNYGYPVIGYGREYSGKPINGDRTAQQGMEQPVYFWTPDIAPAGLAFYDGRLFPAWQGDLFVAALAGKSLVRLVLSSDRVVAEERLLTDLDTRLRGVEPGPDGALYVLTDGANGRILRLRPKK